MHKKIIIIVVIILIFFISIFGISLKKKESKLKSENKTNILNEIETGYIFDEESRTYTIYDKNTNMVLMTTQNPSIVNIYLEDPNFDSSFGGESNSYELD